MNINKTEQIEKSKLASHISSIVNKRQREIEVNAIKNKKRFYTDKIKELENRGYTVDIYHYRNFAKLLTNGKIQTSLIWYSRKSKKMKREIEDGQHGVLLNSGGLTVVEIYNENEYYTGESVCHLNDSYTYYIGIYSAFNRALEMFGEVKFEKQLTEI